MAVNYLGKRKLYEFLKAFCEGRDYIELPKLSKLEYEKYRGDEWLKTKFDCSLDLFCVRGVAIYLSVYKEFELESGECGKREIGRYAYKWINGEWVCVYSRGE